MTKNKSQKGITLIALVVTIIVLLILAGISISMLTGQNGILNRAQEAKEKTDQSQKDENQKMQKYEDIINQYSGNLPTREETTPYFPNDTFSYKEGTLSTGLVIKDSNNNEYVWVEVPKTTEVYTTAGINISSFTDEEYTKIETDLKKYTEDYKDSEFSDTNPDFTKQYKDMLKSVYENGGFWIGRYEAGFDGDTPRVQHIDITTNDKSVIKPNMYPYNWITRDEAQMLATRMNYGDCKGSLIFGIQWNLILKYIEENTVASTEDSNKVLVRTNIKSKLMTDSTTIGNYNNNLWNITNPSAKYSTDYGNVFEICPYPKASNKSVLLTTGADERFLLMNIYDIAGNLREWTLEFYNASSPCVYRGGSYVDSGSLFPAKSSYYDNSSSYNFLGFRIGLWK